MDDTEEVLRLDDERAEIATQRVGGDLSHAGFVEALLLVAAAVGHLSVADGEHICRIHAAGEEAVGRLVRLLDLLHDYLHRLVYLVGVILHRLGAVGSKGGLPVALDGELAVLELHQTAGHKLFETLEEGVLAGNVCKGKIYLEHGLVELPDEALLRDDIAYHGAVEQPAVGGEVVVEGLGAELVAEAGEGIGIAVVYGEGEHSVDMVGELFAPIVKAGF